MSPGGLSDSSSQTLSLPGTPQYMKEETVPRPPMPPSDPYAQQPGTPRIPDMPPHPHSGMRHPTPSDPYSQAPQTPRTHDPYVQPPTGARPQDLQGIRSMDQFGQPRPQDLPGGQFNSAGSAGARPGEPYGNLPPTDPYAQLPSTPRPGSGPQTPQESPSKPQWPRMPQESDPYERPPATPRPVGGLHSPQMPTPRPMDLYAQQPATPRNPAQMAPPTAIPRPPFSRQSSQPSDPYTHPVPTPGAPTSQQDDPYAFPPHTPRPVSESYSTQNPVSRPVDMPPHQQMVQPPVSAGPYTPGTMPGEQQTLRPAMQPPFPPRMPGQMMRPQGMPMGPGDMYVGPQMRPRQPGPPMARFHGYPEGYMPQPGAPHPGMEMGMPREPSVVSTCEGQVYVLI